MNSASNLRALAAIVLILNVFATVAAIIINLPQTNGKVERFNRTLLCEWAYAKHYRTESARRAALPRWLHIYNHHRPHTALGGHPPASRVPNLCGQNS